MSTRRTRTTATLAIVLALAITPTLAACANPVESIIEGATGNQLDLGGQSIPEGFPTSEVPLIDGPVVFGASIGNNDGQVFNVTIKVSGVEAVDQIKAQLEGAGFSTNADLSGTGADGATYITESDKWGVLVVVTQDADNGWVASYTVTSKAAN